MDSRDLGDDGDGTLRRACDQCRVRKIRCDKNTPCSNCVTARRVCSSTGIGQRPKETRQRVLISTQYEKKIDRIEERLGRIEQLLMQLPSILQQQQGLSAAAPPPSSASSSMFDPHYTPPSAPSVSHDLTPSHPGDCVGGTVPRRSSTVVPIIKHDEDDGDDDDTDAESPFEGDSSMTAHTVFASEFLHHAVGRSSVGGGGGGGAPETPSMDAALSSLQNIVQVQRRGSTVADIRFPNQRQVYKAGFTDVPMPPLGVIVGILRELKGNAAQPYTPVTFTLMCSFLGIEEYTEHCRRVYFATEDYSQASFVIAVAGLFYIFEDRAFSENARGDFVAAEASERYRQMCRDNLETALSQFNLLLPAKRENIEALLLGSSYAIEMAKPSLAWQLNSAACQLCLTMGYHRASPSPPQRPQSEMQDQRGGRGGRGSSVVSEEGVTTKRHVLFWFAYTLDKGLALRLGRASVIQDYDITLPRTLGRLPEYDEYRETLNTWVHHAQVQGRIYDELYSPAALTRPVDVRVRTARELAAELKAMAAQLPSMRSSELPRPDPVGVIDMLMKSDEVSFLTSLALCYRAIPPEATGAGISRAFSSECINVAREAMQAHQGCMQLMSESQDLATAYVHWTILYAPFIPFIVIFCHVIETSDADDLRRLVAFVASLEVCRGLSEPVNKLHRLCSALVNVANMYLETKKRTAAPTHHEHQLPLLHDGFPVNMDFDMYFRDLGFMPPPGAEAGGPSVGVVQNVGMSGAAGGVENNFQNANLGDWFSGNLSMLGMLERDMSQFSPSNLPPSTSPAAEQHM